MDVDIRKLTPDLLDDYLYFFEHDAHADNEDEDRCYCVCWCGDDHRVNMDFSTPEKRRELAVRYIGNGMIQGYLAYAGGRVVGWCNANAKADCMNCVSWLRFAAAGRVAAYPDDTHVKSVFCFAIAPDMKRQGVATRLLERVIDDAAGDGFAIVEAYPNKEFINMFRDFLGPVEMYKRCGFTVYEETERSFVMRKRL